MHLQAYYKADRWLDVTTTVSQLSIVIQSSALPTVSPSPAPVPTRLPLAPYRAVAAGWYRPIAARRQARGLINPFNTGQTLRGHALHNADSYIGSPDTPKGSNGTALPAFVAPAATRTFWFVAGWYRPHVISKAVRRDPHIFSIDQALPHRARASAKVCSRQDFSPG